MEIRKWPKHTILFVLMKFGASLMIFSFHESTWIIIFYLLRLAILGHVEINEWTDRWTRHWWDFTWNGVHNNNTPVQERCIKARANAEKGY